MDFNAYLRIAEDGRVTVYTGKIEMGQDVVTSLAQMAADELGVALEAIDMVMGDTDRCPFGNGTYGSLSVRVFGPALRSAAAEAKAVLLTLASEHLKLPQEQLKVEKGVVFVAADRSKRVTFSRLAMGQRIARKPDGKAVTKGVADFAVMGRPTKRRDAAVKVSGKALYAGNCLPPPRRGISARVESGSTSIRSGSPNRRTMRGTPALRTAWSSGSSRNSLALCGW